MTTTWRAHWPEYLMEAAGLGLFMISACCFVVLLESPFFPLRQALPDPLVRRALMGLAMGGTAIALIYSPWGRRSGAHYNPATTLTFVRLGKVDHRDGLFYIAAQFAGGIAGVLAAGRLLGLKAADPAVRFAATRPGAGGAGVAFLAEVLISSLMMTMVLHVSNNPRHMKRTGLFAGALIALFITFEAPFSGMSMNPARSLGSALPAHLTQSLWIYFTAPPLGMLLAAELYLRSGTRRAVRCARLNHTGPDRCVFCGSL